MDRNGNGERTVSNWWKHLPFELVWKEYPEVDREFVVLYPTALEPIAPSSMAAKKRICCYIAIPFCQSICDFCFFAKYVASDDTRTAYVDALKKEIDAYAAMPYVQGCEVSALYFGGGTPSALSKEQLGDIMDHLRLRLNFAADIEIEVEFHPLTAELDKLSYVRDKGATRISYGIQSFDDDSLRAMGAPHLGRDSFRAVELAREVGFDKVGFDMMYNTPDQTPETLAKDVQTALSLQVESVSFYGFTIVPRTTIFKRARQQGTRVPVQPKDVMYEMWQETTEQCLSNGYEQYVCTCFGLPNGESAYVQGCWTAPQLEVLAFGAGATSYGINGHVYTNIHNVRDYLAAIDAGRLPVLMGKKVTAAEAMSRYPVLGVRGMELSKVDFTDRFGFKFDDLYGPNLEYLRERDLIVDDDETLRLTAPKGTWYVNNVCKSFFTENNIGRPQIMHNELMGLPVPDLV